MKLAYEHKAYSLREVKDYHNKEGGEQGLVDVIRLYDTNKLGTENHRVEERRDDLNVREEGIKAIIDSELRDIFKEKYDGDVIEECERRVLDNYEVRTRVECDEMTGEPSDQWHYPRLVSEFHKKDLPYHKDERMKWVEEKEFIDNLEKADKGTKISVLSTYYWWGNQPQDFVLNNLPKLIKRALGESYRYCLKKGKIIVPEEHLVSEESIKAWQEKQKKNNKNNSMEKTMLRDMVREKKNEFRIIFDGVSSRITRTANGKYQHVHLTLSGFYNKGTCNKTLNDILDITAMSNNAILAMTEEQVRQKVIAYYKKELQEILDALEK